jgi:hypothetical protein
MRSLLHSWSRQAACFTYGTPSSRRPTATSSHQGADRIAWCDALPAEAVKLARPKSRPSSKPYDMCGLSQVSYFISHCFCWKKSAFCWKIIPISRPLFGTFCLINSYSAQRPDDRSNRKNWRNIYWIFCRQLKLNHCGNLRKHATFVPAILQILIPHRRAPHRRFWMAPRFVPIRL